MVERLSDKLVERYHKRCKGKLDSNGALDMSSVTLLNGEAGVRSGVSVKGTSRWIWYGGSGTTDAVDMSCGDNWYTSTAKIVYYWCS